MKSMLGLCGTAVLCLCSTAWGYSYGDPSAAEQAHLEALNRARANPVEEARRLNLSSLMEGIPQTLIEERGLTSEPLPPLVFNAQLRQAALAHSQDMAAQQYFSHTSLDGRTVSDRVNAGGYLYEMLGENLAMRGSLQDVGATAAGLKMHDDLFIDKDYPDRTHRVTLLTPVYKEVGIGIASTPQLVNGSQYTVYYLTDDFALSYDDSRGFVTGVAYADLNNDGRYTAGEGLPGIEVEIVETGAQTTTAGAGGYAIPLYNGDYTVLFSYGGNAQASRSVRIASQNVKVDVLDTDFSTVTPPLSDSLIAAYDAAGANVNIPVMEIPQGSGLYFRVQLRHRANAGWLFDLIGFTRIDKPSGEFPAYRYDAANGIAYLPKVNVGADSYAVELRLINPAPVQLVLHSAQQLPAAQ